MADKRSLTSAQNGKKGGRPKNHSTVLSEQARNYIAEKLDKELGPIVAKAIEQAKEGDKHAREWLSERAWGRVTYTVVTEDEDGNKKPIEGVKIVVQNDK